MSANGRFLSFASLIFQRIEHRVLVKADLFDLALEHAQSKFSLNAQKLPML